MGTGDIQSYGDSVIDPYIKDQTGRTAVLRIEIAEETIFEYVRDRRVTLSTQVGSVGECT